MTKNEIMAYFYKISSDQYKKNVVRMGIPEEKSIDVSTGDIRKLAKRIGVCQSLSNALWETGYHEAKILAVLIADINRIDFEYMDRLKNLTWIDKNALKELETLVSVEERGRLLRSNSKMGKKVGQHK